jgi:AraC family transcriptional regulator of adaptative response/methylated-DNA-[protein]-cysteine methyltransferase
VIESQLTTACESRELFSQIIGVPRNLSESHILKASCLDTPLGSMIAIADDHALYLLEFINCRKLQSEIDRLKQKTKSSIVSGLTLPIQSIENELKQYFDGTLKVFQTPLFFMGSSFQKTTWEALKNIPYGETRSYADIAKAIGRPTAFRAVAQANASNQLAIIIPCHRVVNSNGGIGGYAGGINRKEWLLNHENNNKSFTR